MFTNLTDRLSSAFDRLRGQKWLSDDNIQEALRDVRVALLEADVALPVVKDFIEAVRQKAIGQTVTKTTSACDTFIKVVHDELMYLLGNQSAELSFKAQPPVVFLIAGLQGSGKTTSAAKLTKYLQEKLKKSVMLASTDIYRPAAIDQLETLAKQVGAAFYPSTPNDRPIDIAKAALSDAKKTFKDVLIIDTAGRLHIDETLMDEIKAISHAVNPTETLLVVDSMAGQDAVHVAKAFHEALPLTGIILTKADGDARGGAALSMRMVTGCPIKFMGVGEKIDALELFHPDRMASRILGMGDIVSLVEEAQSKIDQKEAEKIAKKLQKGQRFDFNDFLSQLQQMKKMGSMQDILKKLPAGMAKMAPGAQTMLGDNATQGMEAIILSMTPDERTFPAKLNGSRKQRIAIGSGRSLQEVNKLMKQLTHMQKMMKRMSGQKMKKRLKHLQSHLSPEMMDSLPPEWMR
ncbi:MAG TPA: signal recognition particle protein [Coxiellaceae bacterium]|nr:signal recognition particle protein [Coxiellaceae bacterium]